MSHQRSTSGAFGEQPHLIELTAHSGEGENQLPHAGAWNGYFDPGAGDAESSLSGRVSF